MIDTNAINSGTKREERREHEGEHHQGAQPAEHRLDQHARALVLARRCPS